MTHSPDEPSSPRTAWPLLRGLTSWKMGDLWPDLLAGATLAAISIPEQMATARLAGFPPQAGFVALIAGVIGFALFGDSRRLSVGADFDHRPNLAGSLAALGIGSAHYLGAASTLALSVGVLLAVAGVLRFGFIADLLSIPVTTGFLAGIAGHIVVSQAPEASSPRDAWPTVRAGAVPRRASRVGESLDGRDQPRRTRHHASWRADQRAHSGSDDRGCRRGSGNHAVRT